MSEIEATDAFNEFFVSHCAPNHVAILRPAMGKMSKEQALRLAAWLVSVANDDERFRKILDDIRGT